MTQNVFMHIVVMVVGVIVLLGAAVVGKADKGGQNLNIHKALAGIGIVLVLAGGVGLVVTRALRPTLPHFYTAVPATVFMLLTPIVGLLALKAAPTKKAGLRTLHRIDAMIFFGLAAIVVVLGIIGVRSVLAPLLY